MQKGVLAAVLALGLGCSTVGQVGQEPAATAEAVSKKQANAADDVREAVFRYMFEHNASVMQNNAPIVFLKVEGEQDPSPAFLERFAKQWPPVEPGSSASVSPWTGATDKKTGKRGLIFRVESLRWISDSEAEVVGGYYEGGLSASGNVYRVKSEGGKWVVKSEEMMWIS
ncbi:MAG TPA: hypothetical protein VFC25_18400 [Verrucomicrobiae bacterium]|nr:hypothetical protein [Verrucomicrobiae bacterium]